MNKTTLKEFSTALIRLMLTCDKPYEAETLVEILKDFLRGQAVPGVFHSVMLFEEPQKCSLYPLSDKQHHVNKTSGGEYFRDVVRTMVEAGTPLLAVGVFSITVEHETGKEGLCAVIETSEGNHTKIYVREGQEIKEEPYSQQDAEQWQKNGTRLCNFLPPSVFAKRQPETAVH